MTDALSVIQKHINELTAQFYASCRYVSTHHNAAPLPFTTTRNKEAVSTDERTLFKNEDLTTSPPLNYNENKSYEDSSSRSTAPLTVTPVPLQDALPPEQTPDPPEKFSAVLREMAHDLTMTARKMQEAVLSIPNADKDEAMQNARIIDLQEELQRAIDRRQLAQRSHDEWLGKVEEAMIPVKRH